MIVQLQIQLGIFKFSASLLCSAFLQLLKPTNQQCSHLSQRKVITFFSVQSTPKSAALHRQSLMMASNIVTMSLDSESCRVSARSMSCFCNALISPGVPLDGTIGQYFLITPWIASFKFSGICSAQWTASVMWHVIWHPYTSRRISSYWTLNILWFIRGFNAQTNYRTITYWLSWLGGSFVVQKMRAFPAYATKQSLRPSFGTLKQTGRMDVHFHNFDILESVDSLHVLTTCFATAVSDMGPRCRLCSASSILVTTRITDGNGDSSCWNLLIIPVPTNAFLRLLTAVAMVGISTHISASYWTTRKTLVSCTFTMRYRILSGDVGEHFFRCVRIWRCHWRGLCIMRSMFMDGNKPLEATDTCRFNYAFIMRSLHVMSRNDLIFSGNIPYLTFCDCLKTEV